MKSGLSQQSLPGGTAAVSLADIRELLIAANFCSACITSSDLSNAQREALDDLFSQDWPFIHICDEGLPLHQYWENEPTAAMVMALVAEALGRDDAPGLPRSVSQSLERRRQRGVPTVRFVARASRLRPDEEEDSAVLDIWQVDQFSDDDDEHTLFDLILGQPNPPWGAVRGLRRYRTVIWDEQLWFSRCSSCEAPLLLLPSEIVHRWFTSCPDCGAALRRRLPLWRLLRSLEGV